MSNHPVQTVSPSGDKLKVVLAVLAVVAGIVGFYFLSDKPSLVRASVLVAGLLVAIALAWTSTQGRGFLSFAKEAIRETKRWSGLPAKKRCKLLQSYLSLFW